MKKKLLNGLLFLLLVNITAAQTAGYRYYSVLDTVKASGFYQVGITPALSAHLKADLSDIRIVNDTGKWVPHMITVLPQNNLSQPGKVILPLVEKISDGSNNGFVIENRFGIISDVELKIRNTNAKRYCAISGSDDRKQWFVINDSIQVDPYAATESTESYFQLFFPPVKFRYFRFIFYNNGRDPVEILEVASLQKVFKEQEEERQDNGAASLIQKDSAGISYVKVSREEAFHFDEIRLKTGSVKYFNRKIDLYIPDMPEHSNSNPGRLLKSWTISNNNTLILQAGQNCNAKVFYLLIHNDDNLPLKVLAVNTTTEYKYLVSYLDSGQHYRLVLGNPGATNPQYDLDALKNAFETTIPALGFGKLIRVDEPPVIKAADPKNNKWMLWLVIGVVLVVLLIFTGKMIKEISKRKQDDHL